MNENRICWCITTNRLKIKLGELNVLKNSQKFDKSDQNRTKK